MKQVEQWLRQGIGLDAVALGSTVLERIVRSRMKRAGITDVRQYRQLIRSSPQEWTELVESVVVTETWFFRDREPFSVFVRMVRREWLPAHPTGTLHVLSVPCASGEEPYSIAMALLDSGFPMDRFRIEGIDISRRALLRAERGVYSRNSFRGKELAFRSRHFRPLPAGGYELNPRVRSLVRLRCANLLGNDFTTEQPAYDFVFCRNLLIYFDWATQQVAFDRLTRLLHPAGLLFVGPAELPLALQNGFVPAGIPMAFACRKNGAPTAARPGSARSPAAAAQLLPEPPVSDGAGLPGAPSAAVPDLNRARLLAGESQWAEAAAICQAHLRRYGASAEAYYLLGLASAACGQPQALEYYRKALYLEPNHYEALCEMSALARKNGNLAQAHALARRAVRVQQQLSALPPP